MTVSNALHNDMKKIHDEVLYGEHSIVIPKEVMANEDIYEESKIMFGSLFTEAVNNFADEIAKKGKNRVLAKIENRMRERIAVMPVRQVMAESCCYSEVKVKIIRKEVIQLIGKTDIAKCID